MRPAWSSRTTVTMSCGRPAFFVKRTKRSPSRRTTPSNVPIHRRCSRSSTSDVTRWFAISGVVVLSKTVDCTPSKRTRPATVPSQRYPSLVWTIAATLFWGSERGACQTSCTYCVGRRAGSRASAARAARHAHAAITTRRRPRPARVTGGIVRGDPRRLVPVPHVQAVRGSELSPVPGQHALEPGLRLQPVELRVDRVALRDQRAPRALAIEHAAAGQADHARNERRRLHGHEAVARRRGEATVRERRAVLLQRARLGRDLLQGTVEQRLRAGPGLLH